MMQNGQSFQGLRAFASFRGWQLRWLRSDISAGLLLTTIAVPEQIATARLAGLPPEAGLVAFIMGTIAYIIFGTSRTASVGADSTVATVFVGSLGVVYLPGSPSYIASAAALAVMVGVILFVATLFRAGWIADLLSTPVTTGFLAGIAIHIFISETPVILGFTPGGAKFLPDVTSIAHSIPQTNLPAAIIGFSSIVVTIVPGMRGRHWPGPFVAILCGVALDSAFRFFGIHVDRMLMSPAVVVNPASLADVSIQDVVRMGPLAAIIALVCMMQTAVVLRGFGSDGNALAPVSPNFGALGVGCILSGLSGSFPVNASPPRTAAILALGGRSQLASIVSIVCVVLFLSLGSQLVGLVPKAVFAGILIGIATHLIQAREIKQIFYRGGAEIFSVIITATVVVILPIEVGMLCSIILSLLQSIYSLARPCSVVLSRVPGTSVWWPPSTDENTETLSTVLAFAIGAPINFTNAVHVCRQLERAANSHAPSLRLIVLEASGVAGIDYTGAKILMATVEDLRRRGLSVSLARLSAPKAQEDAYRTGLIHRIGQRNIYRSVQEAIDAAP